MASIKPNFLDMDITKFLDLLPIAVVVTKDDGDIIFCNKKYLWMAGIDSVVDIDGNVKNLEYTLGREEYIHEVEENGHWEFSCMPFRRRDGSMIYTSGSLVRIAVNGDRGQLGVFQDVTAKVLRSKEARVLNDQLLSNIEQMREVKQRSEKYFDKNMRGVLDLLERSMAKTLVA